MPPVRDLRQKMRPYLSFPRGTRIPPPRILFYASDDPALVRRDLELAEALTREFPTGSVVLATGAPDAASRPCPPRLEVVKVPGLRGDEPQRPLARERTRRLRQRVLSTLFDVFLPDLLLLDMVGPEAELEARLLLQRARALRAAVLIGIGHEGPGECSSTEASPASACAPCRHRTCSAAREALAALERARHP